MRPLSSREEVGDRRAPLPDSGLWIVRRNVQAVGGTVRAENRPDGGLSMIVRLPLVQ